jgi:hypothetical protein
MPGLHPMLTNAERTLTRLQRGVPTINRSYSATIILRIDGWQGALFLLCCRRPSGDNYVFAKVWLQGAAAARRRVTNWTKLKRCPGFFGVRQLRAGNNADRAAPDGALRG